MIAIYYIDIVLLVILCFLTIFMFGYCFYCAYRILRSLQMSILLRPTKVLFAHRREGHEAEELRTVVAYQNPFTGDYCVHKSRAGPTGYCNALSDSPDSGVSDAYEPLHPEAPLPGARPHPWGALPGGVPHPPAARPPRELPQLPRLHNIGWKEDPAKPLLAGAAPAPARADNALDNTWNWNYKEYQI